jgi:hypothetical protein
MPPTSPEVTPTDFYFWGAVKNKACTTKPKTTGNRKLVTEDAFAKNGKGLKFCEVICSRDTECLWQCMNSEGSQYEHLRYALTYE